MRALLARAARIDIFRSDLLSGAMGQALVDDDADAIWAEADTAPGAQPGARAHEVIRTFGMDTAPLPDDPGVDCRLRSRLQPCG